MHMDDWDFLWTITAKAMLAAEILRPGLCSLGLMTTSSMASLSSASPKQGRWYQLCPDSFRSHARHRWYGEFTVCHGLRWPQMEYKWLYYIIVMPL